MTTFHLTQEVPAPVTAVWADLSDLGSHAEWMADAASITFVDEQRQGVGTRFDCVTRVGPLRTVDRMEVTRWSEGHELAVRHEGLVQGEGVFRLDPVDPDTTTLTWHEDLRFPWHFGGPLAAVFAGPILRRLWRGNLTRFAARFE